jgi:hypothetical protein
LALIPTQNLARNASYPNLSPRVKELSETDLGQFQEYPTNIVEIVLNLTLAKTNE